MTLSKMPVALFFGQCYSMKWYMVSAWKSFDSVNLTRIEEIVYFLTEIVRTVPSIR